MAAGSVTVAWPSSTALDAVIGACPADMAEGYQSEIDLLPSIRQAIA
jgi:hypothetical protein